MAGIRGKSGPPGNQNAFRHRLAGIAQRRADGVLNPQEQSIPRRNSVRLRTVQISTATPVLAEIYRERLALLVTFNNHRAGVCDKN